MTQIIIPPQLLVAEDSWAQSDPRIVQSGDFTAADRELLLGAAHRWTCEAEIVIRDAAEILPVRGFLAGMAQPQAFALMLAGPLGGQQTGLAGATATAAVNGAGQLGWTLAIDGLAPSVTHLRAGHYLSWIVGARRQMVVLRADLVANASGQATAELGAPIRQSPADNAVVHLNQPGVHMMLQNPLRWTQRRFGLHEVQRLTFQERVI